MAAFNSNQTVLHLPNGRDFPMHAAIPDHHAGALVVRPHSLPLFSSPSFSLLLFLPKTKR